MKKFMLAVSEPCQQNWEAMTPEQKGRFCAACQKTVVDFTDMTDRQLADYFQKPKGSVCGRFYKDQLNRPIVFPAKRLSLPKHFFRYTWPAFLLLLQSCDEQRDERYEIVGAAFETKVTDMPPVVGNVGPEITPADTLADHKKGTTWSPPVLKGEVDYVIERKTSLPVSDVDKGKLLTEMDTSFVMLDFTEVALDSIKITTYPATEDNIIMGGITILQHKDKVEQPTTQAAMSGCVKREPATLVIYPNPVAKGQSLNIQFKEPFTGVYQLYAMSGQVVQTGKLVMGKEQRFTIPIQDLSVGGYIIRLIDEKIKSVVAEKFIVQ